ncbi:MAG TPA: VCBS repeat-containing protein [Polyangiaceae bacterium]
MTRWLGARAALVAATLGGAAGCGQSQSDDGTSRGGSATGGGAGSAGTSQGGRAGASGSAGSAGVSGSAGNAGSAGSAGSGPGRVPSFRKIVLSTDFLCEGATFGDFDRDGTSDVVAGPFWYEGPDFGTSHAIYPRTVFNVRNYSDNFFAFVRDLSGDGWDDIFFVGFPGQAAYWYENPADTGAEWARHDVIASVGNESPDYTDITGDGVPELVYIEMQPDLQSGRYGYAGPGADAREPWDFHAISPLGPYGHFTHGMGVGDVDGDGRSDLIEATGVWRAPASLAGDPLWEKSAHALGQPGGAQMIAHDVDGDGDGDIVTTLVAHGYGLSWFENDAGAFVERNIVPVTAPETGVIMHEPHALALADMNGDGLLDIVTGERHWAHAPEDGDFGAPGRLYWFDAARSGGAVTFTPHLVDEQSGVGTQVVAEDVNGDELVDIVTANKKGAFVFLQEPE